jgi:hypothetical protein
MTWLTADNPYSEGSTMKIECPSCHGHCYIWHRGRSLGKCTTCGGCGIVQVISVANNGVTLADEMQRVVLRSLTEPLPRMSKRGVINAAILSAVLWAGIGYGIAHAQEPNFFKGIPPICQHPPDQEARASCAYILKFDANMKTEYDEAKIKPPPAPAPDESWVYSSTPIPDLGAEERQRHMQEQIDDQHRQLDRQRDKNAYLRAEADDN